MMGFVGKDINEPEGEVLAYLERLWVLYADGRKGNRWSLIDPSPEPPVSSPPLLDSVVPSSPRDFRSAI